MPPLPIHLHLPTLLRYIPAGRFSHHLRNFCCIPFSILSPPTFHLHNNRFINKTSSSSSTTTSTMGNEQSVPHEPSPYADACAPLPTKSALRRSKSNVTNGGYHDLLNVSQGSAETASTATTAALSPSTSPKPLATTATAPATVTTTTAESPAQQQQQQPQKPRYLPNMQPAGKGLLVPTRPYGHHNYPHHQHRQSDPGPHSGGAGGGSATAAAAAAEMSPQWGWYINTTPPTPEMYHSSSTLGGGSSGSSGSGYPPHKMLTGATFPHQLAAVSAAQNNNNTDAASAVKPRLSTVAGGGAIPGTAAPTTVGVVHNPVFQHLQQANSHNKHIWTPVPI
mmetsp:Transcript_24318/g.57613  ORF Transcript_24318/g.57613 Transcript_24318/m.57613 type:complete len:337 (-) Transcript_24318:588-1598(-)